MPEARYRRAPGTLTREVDGELLLVPIIDQVLDLEDCFFRIDSPVGLRVWALLEQEQTVPELVERITADFVVDPATCRGDLDTFLADLVRIGAAHTEPPTPAR